MATTGQRRAQLGSSRSTRPRFARLTDWKLTPLSAKLANGPSLAISTSRRIFLRIRRTSRRAEAAISAVSGHSRLVSVKPHQDGGRWLDEFLELANILSGGSVEHSLHSTHVPPLSPSLSGTSMCGARSLMMSAMATTASLSDTSHWTPPSEVKKVIPRDHQPVRISIPVISS